MINSSPDHTRERMNQAESPLLELTKYFSWAAVSEAARLQSIHWGMGAAHTVNDSWTRNMAELKSDAAMACSILQGVVQKMEIMSVRGTNKLRTIDSHGICYTTGRNQLQSRISQSSD